MYNGNFSLKVFIITEGLKDTGYGHLTRCLSLYQAFDQMGIKATFITNCDETGKNFLSDINLYVYNWLENDSKLIQQITNADIAIIDSYLASKEIYKKISSVVKKAVYIDDFNRIEYPKGIVINGSIGAEKLHYQKRKDLDFYLGLDFIPLRKEFWNVKEKVRTKSIKNVLIIFGGNDFRNLTFTILDFLLIHYPNFTFHIVLGNVNVLKKLRKKYKKNIKFYSQISAKDILALIMKCDIAVSAAGQTTYELAAVGIPTIIIGVADNQKYNIKSWISAGFIRKEIWWNDADLLPTINNEFENLLNNFSPKQFHKANGAQRIVKKLLGNNIKANIILRKFTENDIKIIYELSNDDEVRSASINTNKITWKDHVKWFRDILLDNKAYCLIADSKDGKLIAQIKFNIVGEIALISISVHKNFRGKGYAAEILKLSCNNFFNSFKNIDFIGAYIFQDNLRSIKSFSSVGFKYNSKKLFDERTFYFYLLKRNQIK